MSRRRSTGCRRSLPGTTTALRRRQTAMHYPFFLRLFSSYDAVFNAFKAITKDFSAQERLALFHNNAERVYRL
ncbi:hypothetical protein EVC45_24510 [Paraburkholderia sp. UYCP14C]|nr:hypothetical protein EVC45_24510 [Paraburkholderia sp. UYCP14C]